MLDEAFWAPRRCLLEPLPVIFEAAALLDRAADGDLAGDHAAAGKLLRQADMPAVFEWTEKVWGPIDVNVHRVREIGGLPSRMPKAERFPSRMPSAADQRALIARDGHVCRFCGLPVVAIAARDAIRRAYPEAVRWGARNRDKHAALQCLSLIFDHILPHSRGGSHRPDNLVVTCAPCNAGRSDYTLEELGLEDPRDRAISPSAWDGLARFIQPVVGLY